MNIIDHLGFWEPKVGKSFKRLSDICLKKKKDGGKGFSKKEVENLTEQSKSILRRCVHPELKDNIRTGLIIGKIQSGKTLSFSSLSCLAKDNNIRVIIILSGTKINLFDQTKDRIKEDIVGTHNRKWRAFTAKQINTKESENIRRLLDEDNEMSLIISCMKNKAQLSKVSSFFKENKFNYNALIIDDESDQASLNTYANRNNNRESPTYRNIIDLRKVFKSHTYILYTATPQANLLIDINSPLSPNFGDVISSGTAYTGIKEFFESKNTKKIIKTIPSSQNHNDSSVMPKTLMEATSCFLVGLADGHIKGEDQKEDSNRKDILGQ